MSASSERSSRTGGALKRILDQLPPEMPLQAALEEAEKIKKEEHLAKERLRVELYRQNNMDKKRARDRAYYAKKKALALQAAPAT